jgi:cytochrome b subunit of formate dehydrogenase
MQKGFWIGKIVAMILVVFLLVAGVVMYLWNWLLPDLFNLPLITYWQSLGLLVLVKIVFSFGRFGGHHRHGHSHWKGSWKEKWQHIPDEQKEKWKQKFAEKWCGHWSEPVKAEEAKTVKGE